VHFTSGIELNQATQIGAPMRSVVLPLGLDLADTPTEISGARGKRVLFLSRIDYKKGLDVLIRAFALVTQTHRDAVLLIAGDGPRPLVDSLRALSAELRVSQNISWLGFVHGAQKQDVLARSTLFALPSQSENFGVAAAEAMAAGLPLVVTQGVALSKLVAETGCGLVTDGSVQQVAAAINDLLADEALRARMGESARQAAAIEFSLETFGARLESLYREVLSP
jgi:glycosyltransferase involved in cell wall biosynthesis